MAVDPLVEAMGRHSAMLAELVAIVDDLSARVESLEQTEEEVARQRHA